MQKDEHAIRSLIEKWMEASMAGDLDTVLGLMDEDAIFMVPGREPFDREEFIAGFNAMKAAGHIEGKSEIHELRVLGDWAYVRNRLEITAFAHGKGATRTGFTLTIFRKDSHGNWMLHRDANLLTAA